MKLGEGTNRTPLRTFGAVLALLVLAEIVVIVAFTTKDRPPTQNIAPKVTRATLTNAADPEVAELAIAGQDPDSTVVGFEVDWGDGAAPERIDRGCGASGNAYGGETVTAQASHDAPAGPVRVRALSRSCFGEPSPQTGAWVDASGV